MKQNENLYQVRLKNKQILQIGYDKHSVQQQFTITLMEHNI